MDKETEPVQLRFRATNSGNSAKDVVTFTYRKESGWIFIGIHPPPVPLLFHHRDGAEEKNSKTT